VSNYVLVIPAGAVLAMAMWTWALHLRQQARIEALEGRVANLLAGLSLLTDTTGSRPFAVEPRRTEHVRHLRKYTEAQLPEGRRFVFRAASVPPAGNLAEFERAIHRVPHEALNFHAARGDFSRWIAGALQDATLADVVAGVERDLVARNASSVERARAALAAAVNTRYGIGELAEQESAAAEGAPLGGPDAPGT